MMKRTENRFCFTIFVGGGATAEARGGEHASAVVRSSAAHRDLQVCPPTAPGGSPSTSRTISREPGRTEGRPTSVDEGEFVGEEEDLGEFFPRSEGDGDFL